MHTHAFTQIAEMQDDCRAESPVAARAIVLATFPNLSMNFVKRNLQLVLTLSPEQVVMFIGYPDPTGERAVRRVLADYETDARQGK